MTRAFVWDEGRPFGAAVRGAPQYETTLRLTALLLLMFGAPGQTILVPLLCGVLLVIPACIRQPYIWWGLTILVLVGNAQLWYTIDNHQYLAGYWLLTCALSLTLAEDQARRLFLRRAATRLVALVFGFASLWKLIGGEYLDGSFLYATFATDPRFADIAAVLADVGRDELELASEATEFMTRNAVGGVSVALPDSVILSRTTLVLSWLALIVEGATAVLFMARSERLYHARQTLLLGFVGLTYFVFPVMGFAFVLAILGYAQCHEDDQRWKLAFLALFVVVYLTVLPWQRLLFLV